MNEREIAIARDNYITSARYQAQSLLETETFFILGSDGKNKDLIKDEALRLFDDIDKRIIPETISTTLLDSVYGKTIFREYYITEVGFTVVTKQFARGMYDTLLKDKKCLEIMSGTGALAKALKDAGVDIIATDNYSGINYYPFNSNLWTDVEKIDSLEAIKKYGKDVDCMIMSWIPTESEIGYESLKLLHDINPDCQVIVIGEESATISATSTEKFKENINIIKCYSNYIDSNMPQEDFVHLNFRNNLLINGCGETVYYKTWSTTFDAVYIIEFNENINNEGEDKNEK